MVRVGAGLGISQNTEREEKVAQGLVPVGYGTHRR